MIYDRFNTSDWCVCVNGFAY